MHRYLIQTTRIPCSTYDIHTILMYYWTVHCHTVQRMEPPEVWKPMFSYTSGQLPIWLCSYFAELRMTREKSYARIEDSPVFLDQIRTFSRNLHNLSRKAGSATDPQEQLAFILKVFGFLTSEEVPEPLRSALHQQEYFLARQCSTPVDIWPWATSSEWSRSTLAPNVAEIRLCCLTQGLVCRLVHGLPHSVGTHLLGESPLFGVAIWVRAAIRVRATARPAVRDKTQSVAQSLVTWS